MKKDFIHFINIPFTGLGLHQGYRGDDWFKNRIELFKNYTLKSLLNQTSRNFIIWLTFRPQEKDNPLTREFAKHMMLEIDQSCIFSFDGIMIYDDKYQDEHRFLERLKRTLPELKRLVKNKKWVYLTNIASDDLYCKNAIARFQAEKPGYRKAMGFKAGYLLNARTHQLAKNDPTTNPPFYTIIFPTQIFLNPVKHYNYIGPYKSHEEIPNEFDYKNLRGREYCVMVHGENIGTTWNIPFKGNRIFSPAKDTIFRELGILETKPIKNRLTMRLIIKTIFNYLPFKSLIRKVYYKLCNIN